MKTIPRILTLGAFCSLLAVSPALAGSDGVVMKDGKIMKSHEGEYTELTGEHILENGTRISAAGQVTPKDGEAFQLKEGEMIATDGRFRTHVVLDGVVKKDGKLMKVVNGEKSELSGETSFTDGSKLMADSTVISKEGEKWELGNNDAILSDGRVLLEGSIIVKDDVAYKVNNCMGTPIEDETSLGGAKVRPDRAVTQKDDAGETTINNGDIVKPDGTILRAASEPENSAEDTAAVEEAPAGE